MTTERTPDYLTTHVLAGERLVFALDHEATELASGLASGGHRAVTLVKEEGLRVVLVVLGVGGRLDEHLVAGPTTVLLLKGRVRLTAGGKAVLLLPHQMVALGANVRHDAVAEEDSTLLISVVM